MLQCPDGGEDCDEGEQVADGIRRHVARVHQSRGEDGHGRARERQVLAKLQRAGEKVHRHHREGHCRAVECLREVQRVRRVIRGPERCDQDRFEELRERCRATHDLEALTMCERSGEPGVEELVWEEARRRTRKRRDRSHHRAENNESAERHRCGHNPGATPCPVARLGEKCFRVRRHVPRLSVVGWGHLNGSGRAWIALRDDVGGAVSRAPDDRFERVLG